MLSALKLGVWGGEEKRPHLDRNHLRVPAPLHASRTCDGVRRRRPATRSNTLFGTAFELEMRGKGQVVRGSDLSFQMTRGSTSSWREQCQRPGRARQLRPRHAAGSSDTWRDTRPAHTVLAARRMTRAELHVADRGAVRTETLKGRPGAVTMTCKRVHARSVAHV